MTLVVFRTVGSDEVVGKLIEETDTSYKVSKPLALAMTQQGVGMTAYMIMADPEATFEFLKSTIITAVLANKQAKDAYTCLLYTSPSPRDSVVSRMPSSA